MKTHRPVLVNIYKTARVDTPPHRSKPTRTANTGPKRIKTEKVPKKKPGTKAGFL